MDIQIDINTIKPVEYNVKDLPCWSEEFTTTDIVVGDHINKGGYGDIYRALIKNTFSCVIKVQDISEDAFNEIEMNQKLNGNKYVCKYYGYITSDQSIYMFFDEIGGHNLHDFGRLTKLTRGDIVKIIIEVLKAVKCIHENGVGHFDLHSRNIMIETLTETPYYNITLIDFGLANLLGEEFYPVCANYTAPELREGKLIVATEFMDMYSVGIIMYELFTGSRKVDFTLFYIAFRIPEDIRAFLVNHVFVPKRVSVGEAIKLLGAM